MRRGAALATTFIFSTLLATPARAYVPYRTDQGDFYHWEVSCVPVTIYLNGYSAMTPNEVAKSVAAAAHTWSPDEITCGMGTSATHPFLEIVPSLAVDAGPPPPAMYDARNSLIFRTDRWTMSGKVTGKEYYSGALAITTVFAKSNGRIVDADIEVNVVQGALGGSFGLGFNFANFDDPASVMSHGADTYDLQNTLTHEFGHFVGLDHTCFSSDFAMTPAAPRDDMNQEVPECGSGTPEDQAALQTVMYATTMPGEVSKRWLSPDETRAACETYARARDPRICALDVPNDGIGCAAAGDGRARDGRLAAALALQLLAWALISRRRAPGAGRAPRARPAPCSAAPRPRARRA